MRSATRITGLVALAWIGCVGGDDADGPSGSVTNGRDGLSVCWDRRPSHEIRSLAVAEQSVGFVICLERPE